MFRLLLLCLVGLISNNVYIVNSSTCPEPTDSLWNDLGGNVDSEGVWDALRSFAVSLFGKWDEDEDLVIFHSTVKDWELLYDNVATFLAEAFGAPSDVYEYKGRSLYASHARARGQYNLDATSFALATTYLIDTMNEFLFDECIQERILTIWNSGQCAVIGESNDASPNYECDYGNY